MDKRLNEIIKEKLNEKNLSIREFAARTRMSEAYISCLLEGTGKFIPYYVAKKLYKVFPEYPIETWEQICKEEYNIRKQENNLSHHS